MWVYSRPAYLQRIKLDPSVGRWLDQWLELLADDTHPQWVARPVSLFSLAQLSVTYTHPEDRTMRRQLKKELSRIRNTLLPDFLKGMPSTTLEENDQPWPTDWESWLKQILSDPSSMTQKMCQHLINAVEAGNGDEILKSTRLLTVDLLGRGRSSRELLQRAKQQFLPLSSRVFLPSSKVDFQGRVPIGIIPGPITAGAPSAASSGRVLSWQDKIREIAMPAFERKFAVRIPITITPRPSTWLTRTRIEETYLECANPPLYWIVGEVESTHHETAALKAHQTALSWLGLIRTIFPTRQIRFAEGSVVDAAGGLSTLHAPGCYVVQLPIPKWNPIGGRRHAGRRAANLATTAERLIPEDKVRWHSCLEALGRALREWTENIPLAATAIWIALESLAPRAPTLSSFDRVNTFVAEPYRQGLPLELAQDLATSVSSQAKELSVPWHPSGAHLKNWFFYDKTYPVEKWLEAVLSSGKAQSYTNWEPEPLQIHIERMMEVHSLLASSNPLPGGNADMLADDLALLYGLRNAAVHRSNLSLSEALACYLGNIGLAVLWKAVERIQSVAAAASAPVEIGDALTSPRVALP